MARTHAAQPHPNTGGRFHQDDGILLGKGGEPLPTTPTRGVPTLTPHVQHMDDGELIAPPKPPEPAPVQESVYVCDKTTWQRNMDGYQALHLLDLMLGGLSVTLTPEQFAQVKPDIRWHMRKRPKPVVVEPGDE